MQLLNNVSLLPYNTFHIEAEASSLLMISDRDSCIEILEYLRIQHVSCRFIGGGSNILFTHNSSDCIVVNRLLGKKMISEDDQYAYVNFLSGEVWQDCVHWAVEHDWGGIENLSLIPGSAGAAPIQNIGAYGVELCDVLESLEAVDLQTGEMKIFSNEACAFGYRDSYFKRVGKGHYFIYSITLRLKKNPDFKTHYGDIQQVLSEQFDSVVSIKNISEAVIRIRSAKLPDPAQIGNAGSFFKNPVVDSELAAQLKIEFPGMPQYPASNGIKIAAGWLIEYCGWKGFRNGDAGVHAKQALVLVNYGNASGAQILDLAAQIITSVQQVFNIRLEPEVNIW